MVDAGVYYPHIYVVYEIMDAYYLLLQHEDEELLYRIGLDELIQAEIENAEDSTIDGMKGPWGKLNNQRVDGRTRQKKTTKKNDMP